MKNLSQAFEKFTDKFSRYKSAEEKDKSFLKPVSTDQKLQQHIIQEENDKLEKLKAVLEQYRNPVSKEIEEDETALLKAWELYKKIREAENSVKDEKTFLKEFKIHSPVACKSEYTTGIKLAYLQWWFIQTHGEEKVVPVIKEERNFFYIDFEDAQTFHFTGILRQALSLN